MQRKQIRLTVLPHHSSEIASMRVGFFLRHRFQTAIMEPVYAQLKDRCDCRMFTPEDPDLQADPYGFGPLRRQLADMVAFRPHIVLAGDNIRTLHLRSYLPQTLFVHTRHGLASKGAPYQAARAADYACVTSPYMRQWYIDAGARPRHDFWVVGYTQMDALFRPDPQPLPFDLAADKRVVLYAPTFQRSLTSAHLLGDRTLALLRGRRQDISIIIKPHPLIGNLYPQAMAQWLRLADEEPDVHMVRDAHSDIMPYLRVADLLVTDVSSVALEYLALKRPMVLITSPHIHEEALVDRNGPEWQWRDMGHEVFDIELLPEAISCALEDPDAGLERRQRYHELLFGDLADGQAARRVADHVAALAEHVTPEWRMSLSSGAGRIAIRAAKWKRQVQSWGSTTRY